jgi:hypothetical protein
MLLTSRHAKIEKLVPQSHITVQAKLLSLYLEKKRHVAGSMAKATSHIIISFDGWKADIDQLDMLGIMSHHLDDKYRVESVVLGLHDSFGSHSGEYEESRYVEQNLAQAAVWQVGDG